MPDSDYLHSMQLDDPTFGPGALVELYEQAPELLRTAVAGMTREALQARPIAGRWSSLELIAHLVDVEISFTDRIARTLAADRPSLAAIAEPTDVPQGGFQQCEPDEELQLFATLRRRTARLLRRQPESAWRREALHAEAGPVTVRQLVWQAIRHLQHHLPFLAEKRAAFDNSTDASSDRPPNAAARPPRLHEHQARIAWRYGGPNFLKGQYSREHSWTFDGGVTVPASPAPSVVPRPWSNPANVDPEEALVAAIASCHMLTFLWLASRTGYEVEAYDDEAVGRMTKSASGVPWVSHVRLRPTIAWRGERRPDAAALAQLHAAAHSECYIAQSVRSEITVESPPERSPPS